MLDAARETISFACGRARSELDSDRMLVLTLMKSIEIIGEAAGKISDGERARHAAIPWADIVGMRNRLIHAYFDVNHDVLWQTVVADLSQPVNLLEIALSSEEAT